MKKKTLLMEAKNIFNEFDYNVSHINDFDHQEYFKHAIATLNLCDDIDDAAYVILLMHFIYKHYRSILRGIKHHPVEWDNIKCMNKMLTLKNEEECFTTYLSGAPRKSIALSSIDFGDLPMLFRYHKHVYSLKDSDYSLRLYKNKAVIYKGDEEVVTAIIDKYLEMKLINNKTPYDILNNEYGFSVYYKEYIKEHAVLMDYKKDHENLLAFVQHDDISSIRRQSLSKIDIIEDIPSEDEKLIYFITLAHFLLSKR